MGPADLTRTAAALDAYDVARKAFDDGLAGSTMAEGDRLYDELKKAEQAVREAFADDTSDRNQRSNALLIGVSGINENPENDCWVRKMVREFRAQAARPAKVCCKCWADISDPILPDDEDERCANCGGPY